MGRLAGLLPFQTDACQMTFVSEDAPEFSAYLRIVAPISPLALGVSATPSRLERFEGLPSDETTSLDVGQQEQDIGG